MIPIILKDFQWSQNSDWIFIVVPVKGVKTGSTDIVTSPRYLKVHSPPFIFELFLSHEVDDYLGECVVDEPCEKICFRLKKQEGSFMWDEVEDTKLTKQDKNAIRAEAVEITQQRHKQADEEKQKRRFDRKQATVHDQIRLDAEAKQRITEVKILETEKALRAIDAPATNTGKNEIFTEDDILSSNATNYLTISSGKQMDQEVKWSQKVSIRPSICIPVSFTPRVFPTPSRESTHAEEQEWLKKQAEARKLCGFVDEDLRPEERNPEWLLEKGLSLMRTESYLGAISAFSLGIRLAPKIPELYVERAAAHLAVKNYNRTVDDCCKALELLTPKVAGNLEDRLKCHIRRGAAFRALEMLEEALVDYKEAVSLSKPGNNEELISAQKEIEAALKKQEAAIREERKKTGNSSSVGKEEKVKRGINNGQASHTTTKASTIVTRHSGDDGGSGSSSSFDDGDKEDYD